MEKETIRARRKDGHIGVLPGTTLKPMKSNSSPQIFIAR